MCVVGMKMMLMPVLCFGLLNFGSCNSNAVRGSGNAKTESRAVASFSKIDLTGAPDVEVTVGPATSVELTADDNLLPMIETTVSGETLKIGSKGSYSTSLGVKVKITVPSLDALAISGSGNVHVKGLKTGEMEVKIAGSGNITLTGGVDRLRVHILGSGECPGDRSRGQRCAGFCDWVWRRCRPCERATRRQGDWLGQCAFCRKSAASAKTCHWFRRHRPSLRRRPAQGKSRARKNRWAKFCGALLV